MAEIAPTHHAVTGDATEGTTSTTARNPNEEGYSNFDNVVRGTAGGDEINADSGEAAPRRSSVINGQEVDYETAHRASLDNLEQRRKSSLSSTPGPFNAPTTDDVSRSEVPPSSSVGTNNAPGKAGDLGEKVMGALGYGGAKVERAPEDQGLGEKIVNLLGA